MKKVIAAITGAVMLATCLPTAAVVPQAEEEGSRMARFYEKGNYATSYNPIISRHTDGNNRAWRDGMVSGNGEIGYVTSGEPYSDAFIFQHMYYNYPTGDPRKSPDELPTQLEDARLNIFNLNDNWLITNADGTQHWRTCDYSYHPGQQLRLTDAYTDTAKNYVRWTNYETAETGVKFEDKYGEWIRTSFTSRTDGVVVTKIEKSSANQLINMTVSIDDIDDMCKAWNSTSAVSEQRYKKIVPQDASYIAQMTHYPVYNGSELYDGGYGGVTLIIAEGENARKTRVTSAKDDPMLIGDNAAVRIDNAEAVYLITTLDRSFEMTGKTSNVMAEFERMNSYTLLDELLEKVTAAAEKYTYDGSFDYAAALAPSAQIQKTEFNRMSFNLAGDEEFADYDNDSIIAEQRSENERINHEFLRRAYDQARYAQICCGGTTAPRLYGMWTGEWNPGWRSIYTLDANVSLQVASMNTGNLGGAFQEGYITFFLRHAPDFMKNAEMSYGMHDALQTGVNADADRAMQVEYDNNHPFEYWNAGPSLALLPIYEYWQCFGNQQIPINDYMRFDDLQHVLGVNDGGLTDEEFAELKERGWLDLEKDVLLPLLTKQANLWDQIVTPRYYMDVNGKACHDESKTELNEGEKYMIIPSYSPENHPLGYTSPLTANATMDISAARDGLDMVCALEEAVKRDGYEEAIEKWQTLKNNLPDYKYDVDGAIREWAVDDYAENNNHRHLSHLYVAWPAYETQSDPDLAKAVNIAFDNRNKYNTTDATAGHGWIHKALVEARLKRGEGLVESLLVMMNSDAYYTSLMTDHDTNHRNDTYCTDNTFGMIAAVNEALAFSNTGEIELVPALPSEWSVGSVNGLMARTRVEISELKWDLDMGKVESTLNSLEDNNTVRISCGGAWTEVKVDGQTYEVQVDERGRYITVTLDKDVPVTLEFTLSDTTDGTYTITKDGKYLNVNGDKNGEEIVWGAFSKNSYWNIKNVNDGHVTIQSCAIGKYLTLEDGILVQLNYTGEENQHWNGNDFEMHRQSEFKDVVYTLDKVAITADGEEVESLNLSSGDKVMLGVKFEPEDARTAFNWRTDSIGHGVVSNNILTAYSPGSFTITAETADGDSISCDVHVTGSSRELVKAEIKGIAAADEGWDGNWRPENAFDGLPSTAYASRDDGAVKYIQVELSEPEAITAAYVIGRYSSNAGNGDFNNRINAAKIYASNQAGSLNGGVLVGEVLGVNATSAFASQKVEIDTRGEKYKYYTLYFDIVNNGSNISLSIGELALYTGGERNLKKVTPIVTATAGSNPEYATDGDVNTVYTVENQTADTVKNQYIQFEMDGVNPVGKIVIKRTILPIANPHFYWSDWCLAIGCELQGSFDGESWETISVMNSWPDGTDHQSRLIIEPIEPKAYKYIRYIRTKVKNMNDYAANNWSDLGNRLSLADIEFYAVTPRIHAEIIGRDENTVTISAESDMAGEFNLIAAVYSAENELLSTVKKSVDFESFVPVEIKLDIKTAGEISVFIWDEKLNPIAEKLTA